MNKLPIAKTENLVIQNFENETLIYDLNTNKAFCLNETSSIVYQNCNGKTAFDELKNKTNFTNDLIHLTLAELRKQGFIEMPVDYVSPLAGMSRREAVKKVGLATMFALPIISSVVAPTSANAASGGLPLLATCSSNGQCQSMVCTNLFDINSASIGNFCCTSPLAVVLPGVTLCTLNQSLCNVRCCSGSGSQNPGVIPCSGVNSFPCTCNPAP